MHWMNIRRYKKKRQKQKEIKVDGYKIVIDNPESSESDVVKIMMALEADSNRA